MKSTKIIVDIIDENDNIIKMIDTGIILDKNTNLEKLMETIIKIINRNTKED